MKPPVPHPLRLLIALGLLLIAATAPAATLQLSGPVGASVSIDGRDLGLLPLDGPLDLAPGLYRLECRARGHEDLEQMVILDEPDSWVHARLRPVPLRRRHAITGSLLYAGLGQWYSGATIRGWIYFLGESGGLLTALAGEVQRTNSKDDYVNARAAYDSATLLSDIVYWRGQAELAHQDMKDMEDLRDTGLALAAGAYIVSLLDAWLLFPSVEIGPGTVPPGDSLDAADATAGLHAAVTLSF